MPLSRKASVPRKRKPLPQPLITGARPTGCTCGVDADGRWNTHCGYHAARNAELIAAKDPRPLAERQAEAAANVAKWYRTHRS